MSRQPRRHEEGYIYHVGNRGARRLLVFGDDQDRATFLRLLTDAVDRFEVEVLTYCLLDNHFHFLLRSPNDNLADSMHYVGTLYTQYFNRRYNVDGSLFVGRYWSDPIRDDAHLLAVARYIERNALDVAPDRPPHRYRWSSLGAIIGRRRAPHFLNNQWILECFGGRPNAYLLFVETTIASDSKRLAIAPCLLDQPAWSPQAIEHAAHLVTSTQTWAPGSGRRPESLRRQLIVLLSGERGSLDGATLASRYGFANAATVHTVTTRARQRAGTDPLFASLASTARSLLLAKT